MKYIDPHIHMVSRTTDDYQRMALAGCVAITEPAFWAGFDRSSAQGFYDYFRQLTMSEPARAAQFGRKINFVECPQTLVGLMRRVVERDLDPGEAVRVYHDALAKKAIRPIRALADDLEITEDVLKPEAGAS